MAVAVAQFPLVRRHRMRNGTGKTTPLRIPGPRAGDAAATSPRRCRVPAPRPPGNAAGRLAGASGRAQHVHRRVRGPRGQPPGAGLARSNSATHVGHRFPAAAAASTAGL